VLIVDDEPLIAFGIAAACEAAGHAVAGVAGSLEQALAMVADPGCDVAIVDLNLRGVSALPLLDALRDRGIPFIVLSGYSSRQAGPALAGVPFLSKPCHPRDLIARLAAIGH
jgi:DNA-binding response OmpR family regulator